jgi:hypothetical protein
MPTVNYHGHHVADPEIRRVLQTIADLYGKNVEVTSGDRSFVPKGGSKTSLHLDKRAADLYINGETLHKIFLDLKIYIAMVFDSTKGYEVILHGVHTATGGPHVHIGHYGHRHVGYVVFKTEGLTKAGHGHYDSDQRMIPPAAVTVH